MNTQAGTNSEAENLKLGGKTEVDHQKWPCSFLFNRLLVTSRGVLDGCCIDYDNLLEIEDLRKVFLVDAWNGERMRDLRLEHLAKTENKHRCRACIDNLDVGNLEPVNKELYLQA